MRELEPPDTLYLSSAPAWIGLGAPDEARKELNLIPCANQTHPDVLEVKWLLCAEEENWDAGLAVAKELVAAAPDRASGWLHHAYALRRSKGGGLEQAWDALLPAFDKFPRESTIPYNLACYACQLKRMETARLWLKRAIAAGGKDRVKNMALNDSDLKPLWEEIRKM